MPTSHWQQLNEIVGLIMQVKPKSILDIGVGFGKYGMLAREYLELWDGRERYNDWQVTIDGIEIHQEYKTPIYDYIYDTVHFGSALDIVPLLTSTYDLILLIDVIEHFDKQDGLKLLNQCLVISNNVVISTPLHPSKQGRAFNNEHETHRSTFTAGDLPKNAWIIPNSKSLICLIQKY